MKCCIQRMTQDGTHFSLCGFQEDDAIHPSGLEPFEDNEIIWRHIPHAFKQDNRPGLAKYRILCTMIETAVIEVEAVSHEEALTMANGENSPDVSFDLESTHYTVLPGDGSFGFAEVPVSIPDDAWVPCGADDDEQALLTVALVVNGSRGSRMYLEAYAVHEAECDDPDHVIDNLDGLDVQKDFVHGAFGEETAFDRLAEAHGIEPHCQTITINGRLYALFAEPAGA